MTAEIIAWLNGPEGEAWSKGRSDRNHGAAPQIRRDGPMGGPAEDPCGRPPLTPGQDATTGEAA